MPKTKRAPTPRPTATPEDILRIHTPEVRAIVEHLRTLVKETVPEAEERVYPGWHAFGYRHPEAGYFCGIFPYDDMVKLYFEHGASLPDPDGLLEGDGKRTRYVVARTEESLRLSDVKDLLRAAVLMAG